MGLDALTERLTDNSPVYPGISLEDFIYGALQKGAVEPVNAVRLYASGVHDYFNMNSQVAYALQEVGADYDTETDTKKNMIAPALRVTGDFEIDDQVYVQVAPKAPWQLLKIIGIVQTEQMLGINISDQDVPDDSLIVVKSKNDVWPSIAATSLSLFAKTEYETIMPNNKKRRTQNSLLPIKFNIGLSSFEREVTKSDVTSVFRNFGLPKPGDV